jgi:hypothetical protein
VWAYSVLVSNAEYALEAIGQLYRDRADCENGFDELKSQWGSRYTPHGLERCNLSARAVALIYNGWSWYVRLVHPKARLEAITSRPLLLAGIARLTQHAGQCWRLLTLTQGNRMNAIRFAWPLYEATAGCREALSKCQKVTPYFLPG